MTKRVTDDFRVSVRDWVAYDNKIVKAKNAMLADAIATSVCVMQKNKSIELKKIYPNIEIYTS